MSGKIEGERRGVRFGSFEYRPMLGLLLRDGKPFPIGSRAIAILDALLATPGSFVSTRTLMQAAWPQTFVDPCNLRVQIANLRRAFDHPSERTHIINAPGRGYAFVASVTPVFGATDRQRVAMVEAPPSQAGRPKEGLHVLIVFGPPSPDDPSRIQMKVSMAPWRALRQ